MKAAEIVVEETMNWVNRVVIGLNFCPFAAPVVTHNQLNVKVVESNDLAIILEVIIQECHFLETSKQYETSLVVIPEFDMGKITAFEDYLDLADLANQLMEERYKGIYQLATFHPKYRFAEAKKDDPANYTNRSPYPMFHIIPEASLEKAIKEYPNVDEIPANNIKLAQKKGLASMVALRNGCFVHP